MELTSRTLHSVMAAMMDTLTQPAARLDLSQAVTLIEPTVERRNRRWSSHAADEDAGDPAEAMPAERLSAAPSGRSRNERPGSNGGSLPERESLEVSAGSAGGAWTSDPRAAQGNIARPSGHQEAPGSESRPAVAPDEPKGSPIPARPAFRLHDTDLKGEQPAELPARASSTVKPELRQEAARTVPPLRVAGFPEACVERSVLPESPPGKAAEAGFAKARGSESAVNRSLLADRAGAAAREAALPDACGTLTTPVQILFKPCPRYPEEALRRRLQGEVLLDVEFRYSGTLEVLGVRRGLGQGLNESAIEAARKIRFVAARRDGRPVDTQATLRVRFQLLQ